MEESLNHQEKKSHKNKRIHKLNTFKTLQIINQKEFFNNPLNILNNQIKLHALYIRATKFNSLLSCSLILLILS